MEKVAAHITGTVVRIEKKPGELVKPGDVVLILESTKMEMQPVAEGDVLVVLE
jgi:acetyl-CoA carboxylase biotin carboxyl carrier protein